MCQNCIHGVCRWGIWVYLSKDMAMMTGFEAGRHYYYRNANEDSEIYVKRPVHLTTGTANVFVYCDLLGHIMVGDIKMPLLQVLNRMTAMSRIDTESNIPPSIWYSTCHSRKNPSIRSASNWRPTTENRCRLCLARRWWCRSFGERCTPIYYYKRMLASLPLDSHI